MSTQRIAASDSNPFIQRAILFDLKECRSRRSSPRALFASGGMGNSGAENLERLFNPRSQTPSWLRVHEKCAHRSQNLVSSSPPVPFLFKSIFLPIRFLSGSTARRDKFLESQAHSHCSQLGPPSHVTRPLGRARGTCYKGPRRAPECYGVFWQGGHLTPTEKIDIPST